MKHPSLGIVVVLVVVAASREAASQFPPFLPWSRPVVREDVRPVPIDGDEVADLEPVKTATPALPPPNPSVPTATPGEIGAWLRQCEDRSPTVREAAFRRLVAHPIEASQETVRAFLEGTLAARLSTLELLREWKAPVDALDPWQPETLTPERATALQDWQRTLSTSDASPERVVPSQQDLAPEQRAAASEEIARMLRASGAEADAETAAVRERLARRGATLLPVVDEHLKTATSDRERRLLQALRYRLVASETLAASWPEGLLRLAAPETALRRKSAEELVNRATIDDVLLIRELFRDPDPLVREISLRGLQKIGGDAQTLLLDLLADPEPNVRAAVLKQLEENPGAGIGARVMEYVQTESDADLVGHAVRVLRTLRNKHNDHKAARSLIDLLQHDSWQVRADAAASLGGSRYYYGVSTPRSASAEQQLQADIYAALLALLDDADSFVVSKAVEGLENVDLPLAVTPLLNVIEHHPELAGQVIQILSQSRSLQPLAMPHLRRLAGHESPGVRAAIFSNLSDFGENELAAGITDPDSPVRIAAAQALFRHFESLRRGALSKGNQVPLHLPGNDFEFTVVEPPRPSVFSAIASLFGGSSSPSRKVTVVDDGEETVALVPPADPSRPDSPFPVDAATFPEDGATFPEDAATLIPTRPPQITVVGEPVPSISPEVPYYGVPFHEGDQPPGTALPVQSFPPEVPYFGGFEGYQPPVIVASPVAPLSPFSPSLSPVEQEATPPESGNDTSALQSYIANNSPTVSPEEHDQWLLDFTNGNGRPDWATPLIEPLEAMLDAESLEERMAAAAVLVLMGQSEERMPGLMEAAKGRPEFFDTLARIVPWLVHEKRSALFRQWRAANPPDDDQTGRWLRALAEPADLRNEPVFWDILGEENVSDSLVGKVYSLLRDLYLLDHWADSRNRIPPKVRDELVDQWTARSQTGSEAQRLLALALLIPIDPGKAGEVAEVLDADPSLSDELRRDAFQVRLLLLQANEKARTELVVETLKRKEPMRSRMAIRFLVSDGHYSLRSLRKSIYLRVPSSLDGMSGSPNTPALPKGLELETVTPLLADENGEIAAYAGYFAVLLGDASGMEPLLKQWRQSVKSADRDESNGAIPVLVYRAVGALDDPQYIPVLREIYENMEEHEVRDLYWSIRSMTGPDILTFRKEIRDKYGMENLR